MNIHPTYKANDSVKEWLNEDDTYFAFEQITPLFDPVWCTQTMQIIADSKLNNKQIRTFYVSGADIGNTSAPNLKYLLLIC